MYAQEKAPAIRDEDIVIFLAGPTPQYGGSDPAKESWRDMISMDLDELLANKVKQRIWLICPEPLTRNWNDTECGMGDGQITWEHEWMERADIIVFWHETRWIPNRQTLKHCYHGKERANIGIQFRFEVGLYIARKDKERIFYIPDHAEGIAGPLWWIRNKPDPLLMATSTYENLLKKIITRIVIYKGKIK